MARDLVLLTGATGFLGFRVLLRTLEQGYLVRVAVRSDAKATKLSSNPALKALNRDSQYSFVTIPDFIIPGAFDEALKGVKYVIHVASPIPLKAQPDDDHDKWFVQQAVQGTLGVFESAKKTPSIKRIVVTSSVVANTGVQGLTSAVPGTVITAETRAPLDNGPYGDVQRAYVASKIAALVRAEEWIKENKPHFDVIHIHPSYIWGRDETAESTKDVGSSTNVLALAVATGQSSSEAAKPLSFNHVDDNARAHVLSLDPKTPGNQSFLVTNSGPTEKWDDIFALLEKNYPEALEKGIFKKGSAWSNVYFRGDVRKTEETFGFKLATLEEAVTPILDQYLELLAKEQK